MDALTLAQRALTNALHYDLVEAAQVLDLAFAPDDPPTGDDLDAAAWEAVELLRELSGDVFGEMIAGILEAIAGLRAEGVRS
jgi:hypothetical protein